MSSLYSYGSSSVNVSGGEVNHLKSRDLSTVYISGGAISDLSAEDSSTVTFGARDFRFGDGLTLNGELVLGTGLLSGEWLDGTRWVVDIGLNDPTATILAVLQSVTNGEPGDLNDDGFVSGDDLDIVRSFWGQSVTPGSKLHGDPSGDGLVGGDDLDEVRAHWGEGTTPPNAEVPEPSTFILLTMGTLALLAYTWRKRR